MSDFNPDEYLATQSGFNPDEYLKPAKLKSVYGSKEEALSHFGDTSQIPGSFKAYLQAMNYPFGVTTTALADIAKRIRTGGQEALSEKSLISALKGQAKSPGELATEAIPEIPKAAETPINISSLLWAHKLDPLAQLRMHYATEIPGAFNRPISETMEKQASNVYNSALPEVTATSPQMMKVGLESGARSLKDLITKAVSGFRREREPIIEATKAAGVEISPNAFRRTKVEINRLRTEGGPTNEAVADALENKLKQAESSMLPKESVAEQTLVTPKESSLIDPNTGKPVMTNEATIIPAQPRQAGKGIGAVLSEKSGGKGVSQGGYDPTQKAYYNQSNQSNKAYIADMKAESERMASEAIPADLEAGLPSGGEQLAGINKRWGSFLENKNPQTVMREIKKELRKRNFTAVDAMLVGAGAAPGIADALTGEHKARGGLTALLGAYAAKRGAQYWNNPNTRLSTGVAIQGQAQNPIWDEIARRALINQSYNLGE